MTLGTAIRPKTTKVKLLAYECHLCDSFQDQIWRAPDANVINANEKNAFTCTFHVCILHSVGMPRAKLKKANGTSRHCYLCMQPCCVLCYRFGINFYIKCKMLVSQTFHHRFPNPNSACIFKNLSEFRKRISNTVFKAR